MNILYRNLSTTEIRALIPQRKPEANKNDFGHILIVGGDYNLAGSVIMAAEAAFKTGCGKVTVLTHKEHISPLIARLPCAMSATVDSKSELKKIIKNKTVIAIGSGLGKSSWSLKMFNFFMELETPKVIDADALNLLSESKKTYNLENTILTPHLGEASRLLGEAVEAIQKNRQQAITKLQKKYKSNIVLKGKDSLILGTDQKLFSCPYGNAGMAVAGMGDVLTGIIASLVAQKVKINQAAILGVYLHALAGDLAKEKQGEIGILPTDLINYLSLVINNKF